MEDDGQIIIRDGPELMNSGEGDKFGPRTDQGIHVVPGILGTPSEVAPKPLLHSTPQSCGTGMLHNCAGIKWSGLDPPQSLEQDHETDSLNFACP